MNSSTLDALGAAMGVLRSALFGLALLVGGVAALSFAIRTRRIGPFSPVARFFRSNVDPLLLPVERRVVRSGGNPVNAPWWALAAVVLGGIVLLSLIGFVVGQIDFALGAASRGPRGIVQLLVVWAVAVLRLALMARVISSWFRVSPYSRWMRWAFALTEPMLAPLRRLIPTLGIIDVTPIVAYFALGLVQSLLLSAL